MPTVNSKESVHSIKIPLLATNKRVGDEPPGNVPSTSQVMEASWQRQNERELMSYVIVVEVRGEVCVHYLGGVLLFRAQLQKQWKEIIWFMACVWHIAMSRNPLGRPPAPLQNHKNNRNRLLEKERRMFVTGT